MSEGAAAGRDRKVTIAALGDFAERIDVRSPSEYAEDHVPGAASHPVLDDAERSRIGTLHAQESAFAARRAGAALVARNIATMLETAFAAKPLLVGMRLPPNYGAAYVREFDALFAGIAKARKVPLVPFFFEGFGERNDMFQPDRIHPTAAAQPLLLDNVWPALLPLLGSRR